jgi:glycosyltransferase involved in cell wall biosynthesis
VGPKKPSCGLWMISHYSGLPAEANPQKRQYFIGKHLAENLPVTFFFSRYDYFAGTRREGARRRSLGWGMDLVLVSNPVAYRKNDWKRLLNALTYAVALLFAGLRERCKPAWVYVAVPSNFAAIIGLLLARISGAKFIYEVFDIWSLTFVYLHGLPIRAPAVRALLALDRFLVKRADLVISPLRGFEKYCRDYLRYDTSDKFVFLYQGYEDDSRDLGGGRESEVLGAIQSWLADMKREGRVVFVHAGTIGSSNNIASLCDALSALGSRRPEIATLFVGRGDLESVVAKELETSLSGRYAVFPPIDYYSLMDLLPMCDFALNSHPDIPLYDFGLASLKTMDYIKVGIPVAYLGRQPMVDELAIGFSSASAQEFVERAETVLDDAALYGSYVEGNRRARSGFLWDNLIVRLRKAMNESQPGTIYDNSNTST